LLRQGVLMHISHHTAQEIAREYQRERITQARRHDGWTGLDREGGRGVDSRRSKPMPVAAFAGRASSSYVQRCWQRLLRLTPIRRSA
jgi:hypothetical protein